MQDFPEKKVQSNILSHLNAAGEAQMVDVSEKKITKREAIATGRVLMSQACFEAIQAGDAPKGDVLGTARIAGIMAAKQTSNLIPMCHPLPIKKVNVTFAPDPENIGYTVEASVTTKSETGVEMEALTAASVAALTLYDMAKALDKAMTITDIQLQKKTGGKSGDYLRNSL